MCVLTSRKISLSGALSDRVCRTEFVTRDAHIWNSCHATLSVCSALSASASGSRKLTPGLRPGVRADRQGICQRNRYWYSVGPMLPLAIICVLLLATGYTRGDPTNQTRTFVKRGTSIVSNSCPPAPKPLGWELRARVSLRPGVRADRQGTCQILPDSDMEIYWFCCEGYNFPASPYGFQLSLCQEPVH
eukprot:sb/3471193/